MKSSYLVALAIALVTAAWVASGQLSGQEPPTPAAPGAAAVSGAGPSAEPKRTAVRVARLAAEPMVSDVVLQGRTEAARTVELRAEIAGRVAEVLAPRGARVREGDAILRFALEDRDTQLEQARALLRQREMELEAARSLNAKGFNPEIKVAEARAQYESARLAVARAERELAHTEIRAPFDGVLDARAAEVGDYVDKGKAVGTLVDLDPVKIVGNVSERNVGDLSVGAVGHARLVDGREVEGRIVYVGATADPATRTFPVEIEVPNPDGAIVQGLTAELRLPVDRTLAHRVPPSVLTLADDGTIGVKLVDSDGVVRFAPVTILGSDGPRVWVGGLPETATVVVVGQEFVVDGQPVEAVPVELGSLS